MDRVSVASVAELLELCAARGVTGVAMRVVDEIRPRLCDGGRVEVGRVRFVELFAYDAGTVIAARLDDADAAAVEAALRGAGLTVRRKSGNVG